METNVGSEDKGGVTGDCAVDSETGAPNGRSGTVGLAVIPTSGPFVGTFELGGRLELMIETPKGTKAGAVGLSVASDKGTPKGMNTFVGDPVPSPDSMGDSDGDKETTVGMFADG